MKKQTSPQTNSLRPSPNIRQDKRGKLIELFKGNFAQFNLLEMKKRTVWGGHYHKKTTEYFYVLKGEISVSFQVIESVAFNKKDTWPQTYKAGDSFAIFPYTLHTIRVRKSTTCIVLYSRIFNVKNPDLHYNP